MNLLSNPLQWRVGLVGYGEVGRIVAEDLRAKGVAVAMYDLKLESDAGAPMREHARAHGVSIASAHAPLAGQADLVISAVTASQAVSVAQACAGRIAAGTFFLDFNSASPGAKIRAAGIVDGAGGRYVEGAVMTSVPPHRIRVPLLLGGPHAAALEPGLRALGFDAKPSSEKLGIASATKMCRSVMIKGLEAMVIESLTTARAWGVEDQVLASLQETFPGVRWDEQSSYFFQRVIEHGRRRAEEMREAAQTVREAGLEPWSAEGTAMRQAWVAGLAEQDLFRGEAGEGTARRDWRIQADRILASVTSTARSTAGLPAGSIAESPGQRR
jgi:3-hydroxyisobutyrate dehydrogenase-like beta-hydroxyacid dehydrogenase